MPIWCRSLLLAMVGLTGLVGPTAVAQSRSDYAGLVAAHLRLGLGDGGDVYANGLHSHAALGTSVGFGLRAEARVLDFLTVGGLFEATSFETDLPDPFSDQRRWVFDVDVLARGRWLFEVVRGEVFLEPWVGLPFGLSVGAFNHPTGGGDEGWPGWNIGAMAGLYVLTASRFGGFVELGWRHHEVYSSEDVAVLGHVHYSAVANQFALNFGVLYAIE